MLYKTRKITVIYFALIAMLLVLSACGFKLRGTNALPANLRILYLQSNQPYGPLTKELSTDLADAGVQLVTKSNSAPYTLEILNDKLDQQTTAISISAQTKQILLRYTVSYRLLNNKGVPLLPTQVATATRSQTLNSNQILGDSNETSHLLTLMRRDAVMQIFLWLNSDEVRKVMK